MYFWSKNVRNLLSFGVARRCLCVRRSATALWAEHIPRVQPQAWASALKICSVWSPPPNGSEFWAMHHGPIRVVLINFNSLQQQPEQQIPWLAFSLSISVRSFWYISQPQTRDTLLNNWLPLLHRISPAGFVLYTYIISEHQASCLTKDATCDRKRRCLLYTCNQNDECKSANHLVRWNRNFFLSSHQQYRGWDIERN